MVPNVPIGRITCIIVYLDVPIERITKSHEEVTSIVIQVISTLRNVLLYYVNPVVVTRAYKFTQSYMTGLNIKWTKEYK